MSAPPRWLSGAERNPEAAVPRPRGVLEIADLAFAMLRRDYRLLAPVVAAAAVPFAVLNAVAARVSNGGGHTSVFSLSGARGAWEVAALFVAIAWPAVVAGPAGRLVIARWHGRVPTRALLWGGLRRLPALLLVSILCTLLATAGFFVLVLPTLALFALGRLATPAVVAETANPFRALGRSYGLAGRRFGANLGLACVSLVTSEVVGFILGLLPNVIIGSIGLKYGFVLEAATSVFLVTVNVTWGQINATLMYLDTCARSEGLDLLVRAERATAAAGAAGVAGLRG